MKKTVDEIFGNLPKSDLYKFALSTLSQIALAVLDIAGTALLGIVITQFSASNNNILTLFWAKFESAVPIIRIFNENKLFFLVGLALILFILKAFLVNIISYRTLFFLARRDASRSGFEFNKFFNNSNPALKVNSLIEVTNGLTGGVTGLMVRFALAFQIFCVEFSLIFVFIAYSIFIQNVVLLILVTCFSLITFILHKTLSQKSEESIKVASRQLITSQETIKAAFEMQRELLLANKVSKLEAKFRLSKQGFALKTAENVWLSTLPKYIYELGLYFSLFVAGLISSQFMTQSNLFAEFAIALVVISRIIPSMLRLVSAILTMKSASGQFSMLKSIQQQIYPGKLNSQSDKLIDSFLTGIVFNNLSFKYNGEQKFTIENLSFQLEFGKSLAITGESGSGKSTIADLLCGFLTPAEGHVLLDGIDPRRFRELYPQHLFSVPQRSHLIESSIQENLELFLEDSPSKEHMDLIVDSLRISTFTNLKERGDLLELGDDGQGLSGGQKQRLVLGRALLLSSKYLILDESTNALGDDLEKEIATNILKLRAGLTTVFITHRPDIANLCDEILDISLSR